MPLGKDNFSGKVLALIVSAIAIFSGVRMLVTGEGRRLGKGGLPINFDEHPIYFSVIVIASLAIGFFILYKVFFERDDD